MLTYLQCLPIRMYSTVAKYNVLYTTNPNDFLQREAFIDLSLGWFLHTRCTVVYVAQSKCNARACLLA
jgi:hypothetical protein